MSTSLDRGDRSATRAVDLLSTATGDDYQLVGRLAGGETGATEIRRSDGTRFVMKWELDPENQRCRKVGASLAERLRSEARWPSPEQRLVEADGWLVIVQEFMVGRPVDHLSHDLIDDVFAMHESRLAVPSIDGPSTWADDMLTLLTEGGNGYCLHDPLRTFDQRTRRLVERIEEIGASTRTDELDGHAIVHADLHPGNLLQVDGRLTAAVDMDYTRMGDATFDLTTMAVSSLEISTDEGVRDRLFDRGVRALPEPKRRAYVANPLLRCLDWSIRKNRRSETEFWITASERLLDPA